MKKQYIIPASEVQYFCVESLMNTMSIETGEDITSGEGTVYGDAGRQLWYDNEEEDEE